MTSDALASSRRRLGARVTPPDRTHALGEGGGDDAPAVRELHVVVPLKPQGDAPPATLPPTFARALQDEYAARYLSQLGASATPENVAVVLEHLPLAGCKLTAAWRARGALADELTIDLYPPKPAPAIEPPSRRSKSESSGGGDAVAVDGGLHTRYYCFGPVCWSFDDMKRKFLPPFCEATPPANATTIAIDKRKPVAALSHVSVSPTGGDSVSQILGRRATLQQEQCASERRSPPDTRRETICAMHRAFFSALPLVPLGLSTRGTRGLDRDLAQRLLDALVGDVEVLELVQSVALLLYHEVFVPTTSVTLPTVPNSVETLLVDSVRLFSAVRDRYGSWKAPSSFTANASSVVPMLLLALRVDVETLFRMQYPQSFCCSSSPATTAQAHRVLAEMNARITRLVDPDSHWSRVPVLESSCAAGVARSAPTFQRQRRRVRLRDQFFRTSEALHCVFPVPAAGSSRRIMAVGGGTQVARYSSVVPASDHTAEVGPGPVSVESKLKLLRLLQHR